MNICTILILPILLGFCHSFGQDQTQEDSLGEHIANVIDVSSDVTVEELARGDEPWIDVVRITAPEIELVDGEDVDIDGRWIKFQFDYRIVWFPGRPHEIRCFTDDRVGPSFVCGSNEDKFGWYWKPWEQPTSLMFGSKQIDILASRFSERGMDIEEATMMIQFEFAKLLASGTTLELFEEVLSAKRSSVVNANTPSEITNNAILYYSRLAFTDRVRGSDITPKHEFRMMKIQFGDRTIYVTPTKGTRYGYYLSFFSFDWAGKLEWRGDVSCSTDSDWYDKPKELVYAIIGGPNATVEVIREITYPPGKPKSETPVDSVKETEPSEKTSCDDEEH